MADAADHLLASIYYRENDQRALATRNALRLKAHKNVFLEEIDKRLWKYAQKYLLKERVAPSEVILTSILEKDMATDVLARMESLKSLKVCEEKEFKHFLDDAHKEVKSRECSILLSTAGQILSGNYKAEKGAKEREGYRDAVRYVLEQGLDFLYEDTSGEKLRGDIRKEGSEMVQEYLKVKENKKDTVGILTGLEHIDLQTHGIRRGELWIVAGHTSEGKTTLSLNVAHNAVCAGYNVLFASMEMPRYRVRQIIYCIHSGNKKFANIHKPLKLNDIRYGNLDPEAEKFYIDHVIEDFENNPRYGTLELVQPTEVWTAATLQAEAELVNEQVPGGLDLVIPDYVGLMGVEGRSEGRNEDLNKIIRGIKNMTLTFNGGDQIAALSPFQTNREGKKRADQNEGVYDTQALSNAHEAERSADVVLSIYMNDELKESQSAILCQLKGRDTGCAPPKQIHANLPSRIIRSNAPNSAALESSNWMDNLMVGI